MCGVLGEPGRGVESGTPFARLSSLRLYLLLVEVDHESEKERDT